MSWAEFLLLALLLRGSFDVLICDAKVLVLLAQERSSLLGYTRVLVALHRCFLDVVDLVDAKPCWQRLEPSGPRSQNWQLELRIGS